MRGRRAGSRWAGGLATILGATVAGLLLAEAVVRVTGADWRFVRRVVYTQAVFLPSHQPDPDPLLRYRLRPGRAVYDSCVVTVNSLGYRGPERPASKPPGVTRIFVTGGSNAFGFAVNDDRTWPARLEARLNGRRPGGFEVWNAAACAYVGCQMARSAQRALATIAPDLVILAPTNFNQIPFLKDAPIAPYFAADPTTWLLHLPESALWFPPRGSVEARLWVMNRWGLYRMAVLARNARRMAEFRRASDESERRNRGALRGFVGERRRDVRIAFFLCPARGPVKDYTTGLDVPVLYLPPDGLPPEYAEIHPPPYVLDWYAEKLAAWLVEEKLVP